MLNIKNFREEAHKMVDWMADYLESIQDYPILSQVEPNTIYDALPNDPPQDSESIPQIMKDFNELIMPGITHWQSPNFHAYFPANSSRPSILAEMLTATLGTQCMMWSTSPAAAELEEKMMDWLKTMLGLPDHFEGTIQDTASTATLCAIITAREKHSDYQVNQKGFSTQKIFRVYCSTETHSSIEKGVKIAGLGQENLVKIPVDEVLAMKADLLEKAIKEDIAAGYQPVCVVAAIGTTGTTAIDPLKSIAAICQKYDVWLHVDAAYAGNACILPEYRWMIEGTETADSFVFNPHKWLFTNFDCTAYFVKDRQTLLKTFSISPEYLKTRKDGAVNNYKDWGIPLGRRFRALKLWFVIRNFGVKGLQAIIRGHIQMAQDLSKVIEKREDFELLAPTNLNLICFRYHPPHIQDETLLNKLNADLLHAANASGQLFISHTKVNGKYTLRMCIAQTYVEPKHMWAAWEALLKCLP